jgi:hypothetical protein
LGVVNLGNIKNKPIFRLFKDIKHTWSDEEKVGTFVKLDIPFVFSENKTYIVLLRSIDGNVTVDGTKMNVDAINLSSNMERSISLSGGAKMSVSATHISYVISFPTYSGPDGTGVYILRPKETSAVSLFDVGIYEL